MDHLRSLNEIRVQRNIGISAVTLEETGVLNASLFCRSSIHFFPLQENCNRIQKLDSWLRAKFYRKAVDIEKIYTNCFFI